MTMLALIAGIVGVMLLGVMIPARARRDPGQLACSLREAAMTALLSLLVCLASAPHVCETVIPDYVSVETGQPPTFFECLGVGGQDIARQWLAEHPRYVLQRVQCSVATDPVRLRDQIASPEA